jgi:tryptophan-rich sensory protein
MTWYNALIKPSWTPAPSTIGLVWRILYPIILVSFGVVFYRTARGRLSGWVALPFAINLIANLSFPFLQMQLRNNPLALADILVVWATLPWAAWMIWPHLPWVAWAQLPYFVWVSIATYLQLYITWANA